jgi:hypothetical protein
MNSRRDIFSLLPCTSAPTYSSVVTVSLVSGDVRSIRYALNATTRFLPLCSARSLLFFRRTIIDLCRKDRALSLPHSPFCGCNERLAKSDSPVHIPCIGQLASAWLSKFTTTTTCLAEPFMHSATVPNPGCWVLSRRLQIQGRRTQYQAFRTSSLRR